MGGVYQKGVTAEGQCKLMCSKDQKCNGVDWDINEPSCYLLFTSDLKRSSVMEPLHHWEILRNLQTNCLQGKPTS